MKVASFCLLLLLVACRKDEPPAPTAEQNAQLNDADAMLNKLGDNQTAPSSNETAGGDFR